jgi:hypothetical protein
MGPLTYGPHTDDLEEPLERMAVGVEATMEVQPPPDQVTQLGSAGTTPPAPPQVESGEPISSKYSGFSTLYLEMEAKEKLERAQAEAKQVDEDEIVDVEAVDETVISEFEIKPEAIPGENEKTDKHQGENSKVCLTLCGS